MNISFCKPIDLSICFVSVLFCVLFCDSSPEYFKRNRNIGGNVTNAAGSYHGNHDFEELCLKPLEWDNIKQIECINESK